MLIVLEGMGLEVEHLHFPRYEAPVFGPLISAYLRGEFGPIEAVHPRLVALIFAEDRRAAAPMLSHLLSEGKCVILDRYVYSNIAFQCAKSAPSEAAALKDWILELEYGTFAIPRPDLNLFLDVPLSFVGEKLSSAREGSDRDYLSGKHDIHEQNLTFQERVRERYMELCAEDPGFVRIDCSRPEGGMAAPDEIFRRICDGGLARAGLFNSTR